MESISSVKNTTSASHCLDHSACFSTWCVTKIGIQCQHCYLNYREIGFFRWVFDNIPLRWWQPSEVRHCYQEPENRANLQLTDRWILAMSFGHWVQAVPEVCLWASSFMQTNAFSFLLKPFSLGVLLHPKELSDKIMMQCFIFLTGKHHLNVPIT